MSVDLKESLSSIGFTILMNDTSLRSGWLLALCAVLLICNTALEWVVDENEGISWPGNVLRNWHEYGLGKLEGKLAKNPGGYGLPENPEIYSGHRPFTLYPVFAMQRLFGNKVGISVFFALLSAVVFLSMAFLLGWNERSFLVAGISILTPGYLLWPKILDPNTTAALLGAGYAALIWWKLRQPKLRWTDLLLLAIGSFVFTSLNWTTALIHGQIFCFLLAQKVPLRRLAIYMAMGALALAPVVLASVRAKMAGQSTTSGGLAAFLSIYAWGNSGGYSEGSTTPVLLFRYAFINALALAPVWLILAATWVGRARKSLGSGLLTLTPLFMALIQTLTLRNYFCHHPWMASPFLLVGAVLSLSVLFINEPQEETIRSYFSLRRPLSWLGIAATFSFTLLTLVSYRMNRSALDQMRDVVQRGTERSTEVVVSRETSPELAAEGTADFLDRRLTVVPKLGDARDLVRPGVLLSTEELSEDWNLVAKSSPPSAPLFRWLQGPLTWFQNKVSRRQATRVSAPRAYFLYGAAGSSNVAPSSASLKLSLMGFTQ